MTRLTVPSLALWNCCWSLVLTLDAARLAVPFFVACDVGWHAWIALELTFRFVPLLAGGNVCGHAGIAFKLASLLAPFLAGRHCSGRFTDWWWNHLAVDTVPGVARHHCERREYAVGLNGKKKGGLTSWLEGAAALAVEFVPLLLAGASSSGERLADSASTLAALATELLVSWTAVHWRRADWILDTFAFFTVEDETRGTADGAWCTGRNLVDRITFLSLLLALDCERCEVIKNNW
jgi:hypothetical protein